MKILKTTFKVILTLLCLISYSCKKFSLLKDSTLNTVDSGENLKSMSIWQYVSSDQSNTMASITSYYKAIKLTGLEDTLTSADITVIIPTDLAFTNYLRLLGYSKLEDVPIPILRNALLGNIKKGKMLSTDLKLGETLGFSALNGDSIYLTRNAGYYDDYVFTINKNNKLSAPAVVARTQNLSFNNGAAHVVDTFPYYGISSPLSDPPAPNLPVQTVSYNVTKDVYIRPGANAALTFNETNQVVVKGGTNTATQRFGLFQFPLGTPSFGKRIGAAKLNLYATTFDTGTTNPLNIFSTEAKDWIESSTTFNNAPKFSNIPFATASIQLSSLPGYISIDITDEIASALKNDKTFINLGVVTGIEGSMTIRPREYQSGNFKSFISISSSPPTLLMNLTQSAVNAEALTGFKIIRADNLSMTGTSDKNIFFKVNKLPSNGYMVKSGIPLRVNDNFTQADIKNGVIKYLYAGPGNTDIIELEARDHHGGYYNDPITLSITIN